MLTYHQMSPHEQGLCKLARLLVCFYMHANETKSAHWHGHTCTFTCSNVQTDHTQHVSIICFHCARGMLVQESDFEESLFSVT